MLGELLLDFLHLFGEDFDMTREGFSVRGGGFRFRVHDRPPHPQAGDPIVIEVSQQFVREDVYSCGRTIPPLRCQLSYIQDRLIKPGRGVFCSASLPSFPERSASSLCNQLEGLRKWLAQRPCHIGARDFFSNDGLQRSFLYGNTSSHKSPPRYHADRSVLAILAVIPYR